MHRTISRAFDSGFHIVTGYFVLILLASISACAAPRSHTAASEVTPRAVSFNQDIRPILSENCFSCHGPDHNKRMAGLRLDRESASLRHGVLVAGKPEKSALIARIFTGEAGRIMPPPFSHKHLSPAQKALLLRWVREGARYEPHWAFVPLPPSVLVPTTHNRSWPRNAIDHFVLARLEREGIRPSPDASKAIWLRRVTLDLTGLPPTPQEIATFIEDKAPNAFEKVVDRLLASPRYGERMALPWLDVARYADSYGYQSDQLCPTWPYRDWVVKAFNENLPYDRFITDQLAGDLLPGATRETRLATAFNRLHRMTNEGGSVAEEWRQEGVADRVKTFGTAFLGLTTECARCHDHKYDPITQRDYYSLAAFFNNINEHGLYDQGGIVPTPSLLLPTPEQEKATTAARDAITQAEQALTKSRQDRESAFRAWLALPHSPIITDTIGRFDFERFDGARLSNQVPGAAAFGERSDEVPLVEGHSGKAAQFDGENNLHFPAFNQFTRHTPFTIAFWMRDPRLVEGAAVVYQACAGTDTGPYGYDLTVENGRLTARLMRHWPGNAIAVETRQAIPKNVWSHVTVTYDGSSHAAGLHIYLNGQPAAVSVIADKLYKGIGQQPLVFGQRFRDRGFKGGRIDDLAVFSRDLTPLEVAHLYDGHALADSLAQPELHEAALRDYYFGAVDPVTREATRKLSLARAQLVAAEDAQFEIAVMEEMPQERLTYLLARGRYDAPVTAADRVPRGTPSDIFPFPHNLPSNRLGLAQWLLLPNHPLTARVAVNRLWTIFFGKGLVTTIEDFGTQGKPPTHPELLDYLARDFIQSGWNVKRMMKLIALSHTYRQASALRPDLRKYDPQNNLLARGPSHRLSGEAIRDTALAASGLLSERLGGPPVSPYQPGDLWRESNSMSPAYQQSKGADLYRRSLYTVWKRTAPMPNMTAFDATSREVCTARRGSTNTPLQALILLNDTQFVEAARAVGQRVLLESGPSPAEHVRYTFLLLASREPTREEESLIVALYEGQRVAFTRDSEGANKLIHVGESKVDPNLPTADLAAATILAQTVLNLDATVWKR